MREETATLSRGEEGEGTLPRFTASPSALLLAVGFALYVFVQVGLVFGPIISRPVPDIEILRPDTPVGLVDLLNRMLTSLPPTNLLRPVAAQSCAVAPSSSA